MKGNCRRIWCLQKPSGFWNRMNCFPCVVRATQERHKGAKYKGLGGDWWYWWLTVINQNLLLKFYRCNKKHIRVINMGKQSGWICYSERRTSLWRVWTHTTSVARREVCTTTKLESQVLPVFCWAIRSQRSHFHIVQLVPCTVWSLLPTSRHTNTQGKNKTVSFIRPSANKTAASVVVGVHLVNLWFKVWRKRENVSISPLK